MALSYGTTGPAVAALQSQLNALGAGQTVHPNGIVVDGVYGDDTQKALDAAYVVLGIDGYSGIASDELLQALTARVGAGKAVIVSGGNVGVSTASSPGAGMPLPVKLGLSAAGLAVAVGFLTKKK